MLLIMVLFILPGLAKADVQTTLENLARHYGAAREFSGTLTIREGAREFTVVAGAGNLPDTIYPIASNTKQFVAASILKAEEAGLLRTGDKVAAYFPEMSATTFMRDGRAVRIADLLQNVSGLRGVEDHPSIKPLFTKELITIRQILSALDGQPLSFAPGERFDYADINFLLAGEIIRRASGKSFSAFLREDLLIFGGKDIQIGRERNADRVARSYEWRGENREDYYDLYGITDDQSNDDFTDGNVFASAPAMAKWMQDLFGGKILEPRSLEKLVTPRHDGYAYAWNIRSCADGSKIYYHDGSFAGFSSRILYFPQRDISVAILRNEWQHGSEFLTKVLAVFGLKTPETADCEARLRF